MDKQYSTELAIEEFNNEITKLNAEIIQLRKIIDSSDISLDQKKDALYTDLAKKEALLSILQERKDALSSLSENVSYRGKKTTGEENEENISFNDSQLNKIETKLATSQAALADMPADSKNIYIQIMKKRAQKNIKKLENKKGRIEKVQKKIIKTKVKLELMSMTRKTKLDGKIEGVNNIIEKYNELEASMVDKANESLNNNKFIKGVYYSYRSLSSRRKAGIYSAYLAFLQKKAGVVEGFNSLPNRFRIWLASRIMPSGRSRT